jgi:hypothetical protein
VWLILLELTVLRFLITADFFPHGTYLGQTIWALGWSMIILAGLIYLPLSAIAAIGGIMVAIHNAFDGVKLPPCTPGAPQCGGGDLLAYVLHVQTLLQLRPGGPFFLAFYPLVPWVGVMALGFAFGRLYTMDAVVRRRMLVRLGLGIIVLLVVLARDEPLWRSEQVVRAAAAGFHGTLLPESDEVSAVAALSLHDARSGDPAARLPGARTAQRDRPRPRDVRASAAHVLRPAVGMGARLAFVAYRLAGKPTDALYLLHNNSPAALAKAGFSLGVVYVMWIAGVFALYPICAWYAALKRRRNDWWLGYL